jgi:hypothetical protein
MSKVIDFDPNGHGILEDLLFSSSELIAQERILLALGRMCAAGIVPQIIFDQVNSQECSSEFLLSVVEHYATARDICNPYSKSIEISEDRVHEFTVREIDFNDFTTHQEFLSASGHRLKIPRASALFSALQDIYGITWNDISLGLIDTTLDSHQGKYGHYSVKEFVKSNPVLIPAVLNYPLRTSLRRGQEINFSITNAYGLFAWMFSRETLHYSDHFPEKKA